MKTELQIKSLLKALGEGLFEKQHLLAMSLLSAVAGESIFLLGPPGTAKSMIARRLKQAFAQGSAFEYLMSRFSTPDEIFGPVSISKLKNEDRYERVVDGFMPTASIVFLDEIWKASPSIQNTLLTAINERIYRNGRETIDLPMKVLIAASNELPAEDEGLEAIWDRFLVRMVSNCIQSESTFFKMVKQQQPAATDVPAQLAITDEQYRLLQEQIAGIALPDSICHAISHIRKRFKEESNHEDFSPMDFYTSDRRWKKCVRLLQTSALLNGRQAIDATDLPILIYCLWNKAETIPTVIDAVCGSITADIDNGLSKLERDIDTAIRQSASKGDEKKPASTPQPSRFMLTDYFYYTLQNYPDGKCQIYKTDYGHIDTQSPVDGIIYLDETRGEWIIHVILTGNLFDYKNNRAKSVKKVKLLKCPGGIVIDGMPYAFEKLPNAESENAGSSLAVATRQAMKTLETNIKPELARLQGLFEKDCNLFLSADDLKICRKYLTACEKRLNEASVKIENAQHLS